MVLGTEGSFIYKLHFGFFFFKLKLKNLKEVLSNAKDQYPAVYISGSQSSSELQSLEKH